MNAGMSIENCDDYLRVNVHGDYTLDQAINRFRQALEASQLSRIDKILIDFNELGQWSTMMTDRYLYSASVSGMLVEHARKTGMLCRVAYCGPLEGQDVEYSLKVAAQYGFQDIMAFEDFDEALRWLRNDKWQN